MLAFDSFGKTLIYLGVILVIVGVVLHYGGKFFSFGRLPGDIHWEKGNFSFHFPIVTSLILSILLTVILNLFTRR